MSTLTVAEVLRRATTVIDEQGWCQRLTMDARGRVCAIGAIQVATGRWGGSTLFDGAFEAVDDAIAEVVEVIGGEFLSSWNDEVGRTADEVKAALLAAAEKASKS